MAYNSKNSSVIAAKSNSNSDPLSRPMMTVKQVMQEYINRTVTEPDKFPIKIEGARPPLSEKTDGEDKVVRRPCNNFELNETKGTPTCKHCGVQETQHRKTAAFNARNAGKKLASEESEAFDDYDENYSELFENDPDEEQETYNHAPQICPDCKGKSLMNNPETPKYTGNHCDSCDEKCGSDETNPHPHCKGCKHQNTSCKGREQEFWNNDKNDFCETCDNKGVIDEFNAMPKYNFKDEDDEPEEDGSTRIYEDDDDDYEPSPASSKITPVSVAEDEDEKLPAKIQPIVDKVYEPIKVEKHDPNCSKCEGTGIVNDPSEIAKIHDSEEFKQGIKAIKAKKIIPAAKRSEQNQFIADQYECKG